MCNVSDHLIDARIVTLRM